MTLFNLPRTVNIANSKLRLLHWLLFLVVLCSTGVHFFLARQYLSPKSLKPIISAQIWPSFPSYENMKEGMEHAIRNSDSCRLSPDQVSSPISCLPMCPQGFQDWDCIQVSDLFEQPSPERLMLVTRVDETFYQSKSSRHSVPNARRYWTLPSRNLSINMAYSYSVRERALDRPASPLLHLFGQSTREAFNRASSRGGEGVKGLRTIILDAKGQFRRAVSPGYLKLTMSEMLDLSDDRALLGSSNQYPNINPTVAFQGAKLELAIQCYNVNNPDFEDLELPEEVNDRDLSSTCSLRVHRLPVAFDSINRHGYIEGGYFERSAVGLDFSFSYSGEFEYVDLWQVFVSLMACMVALSFPAKVVLFISLHCLGHLSRMYKRALVYDFDISDQVVGAAVRLAQLSSSYEVFGEHVTTNGISLPKFHERLQLALRRDPNLSGEEIAAMANFCFGHALEQRRPEVLNTESSGKQSMLKRAKIVAGMGTISSELGMKQSRQSHSSDKCNGVMCLEDFCSACCSAEPFTLTDMGMFFDKDRKTTFGERVFTPARLWRAVREANEVSKSEEDLEAGRSAHGVQSVTSSDPGGSAAEDVKALATSLSIVLDRLSAAELRLAESERAGMEWKHQSAALDIAMGQIETRLQALEGRIESGVQIQAKRALCGDMDSTAPSDSNQAEQRLLHPVCMHESGVASKDVTEALDALKDRVVMLERRMAIAAADLFDILHDRKDLRQDYA